MPKITDLSAQTVPGANDVLAIVDIASATTKKITRTNLLKGAVLPNDTVTTAAITDGAVTNSKLSTGAGEPGDWTSWTPSFTGFTLGNGTINEAKYTKVGKTITAKIYVTLGTTSSMGNFSAITLPVTAQFISTSNVLGNGMANDANGSSYLLGARVESSTTMRVIAWNSSAANLSVAGVSTSTPFSWVSTDSFQAIITYEAA